MTIAVCVPLARGGDAVLPCLAALVAHTPAAVEIVVGAATADPSAADHARALERDVSWIEAPADGGLVGALNAALDACAPADAVVVDPDCVVAAGYLDRMLDAIRDTTVATASALANAAGPLSVPDRNFPMPRLPQDVTLDAAAARLAERSPRLRPRIPAAVGGCFLVARRAIELVGPLDPALAAPAALRDFSARCVARGLQHVAADDVLVERRGDEAAMPEGDAAIVAERHPALGPALAEARDDRTSGLARTLLVARQAIAGRRVTIDARSLGPHFGGTQVHTLELIAALARADAGRIRVLVPEAVGAYATTALDALDGVELLTTAGAAQATRDDVVHRPFQVTDPGDVELLAGLGERLVVTQQDLIAYRSPAYFDSPDAWLAYRRLTREALAFADLVVFFSAHAAGDALADDLLAPGQARVVPIGVDHAATGRHAEPRPPAGAAALDGVPFLLCLGATFAHKNRPFALEVLTALRERHGWDGRLVLAGPEMANGSSGPAEAGWALGHGGDDEAVVRLPAVSDAEKAWLYAHAAAVLYPTTYEGFGLVPFEAADAGTPCLWPPQASLPEVVPADAAVVVPWDAAATADRAIVVLRDTDRATALVDQVRAAGRELTWDRTAARLVEVYDEAVLRPAPEARRLAEAAMVTQARYWALRHDIGDTGMALVGPDAPLLPPDVQRAVAALARRPATRGALLGLLRKLQRGGPTLDA